MILQSLYELAQRERLVEDPDFEPKPVAYVVRVGSDGRLLGFQSTKEVEPVEGKGKRKPQARAKVFDVPREPSRTSGDRANFLIDKAEYVFGIDPTGERPADKLATRRALFRERVAACARATKDEGAAAVLRFLDAQAEGSVSVTLPEDCAANDLFALAFDLDDGFVVHRPAIRGYWRSQREASVSTEEVLCLVSGRKGPPATRHSILKHVPNAVSSGVPLVSFNASAFESYGWQGSENAPVSQEAAEAYAAALQRLIHPAPPDPSHPSSTLPRRNVRLGADTVVGYWAARESDFLDSLDPLLEAREEDVRDLYRSIFTGRAPKIDPAPFYALTLSGAQGRVVVRGYFESTVAEVAANLAKHFEDLAIVRNTPRPKSGVLRSCAALETLLRSLSVLGKREAVPAALGEQVFRAALGGTRYPFNVLQRALERTRAEIGATDWADLERRDARAALIKAELNRRHRNESTFREVTPAMDSANTNPGYLLGRAMAVVERLQQLALGDVNASVVDRFFSAASAAPQSVFTRLLKNARHHARKARDDEKKGGYAVHLERLLDEVLAPFEPKKNAFPPFLDLDQQGLFVLGYHHQRHAFFTKKDAVEPAPSESPET